MPSTVFSVRGLTKAYISGEVVVHALRGVDLEVRSGEVIVLLGPSGSGKSTLLNIMGGSTPLPAALSSSRISTSPSSMTVA